MWSYAPTTGSVIVVTLRATLIFTGLEVLQLIGIESEVTLPCRLSLLYLKMISVGANETARSNFTAFSFLISALAAKISAFNDDSSSLDSILTFYVFTNFVAWVLIVDFFLTAFSVLCDFLLYSFKCIDDYWEGSFSRRGLDFLTNFVDYFFNAALFVGFYATAFCFYVSDGICNDDYWDSLLILDNDLFLFFLTTIVLQVIIR